MAKLNGLISDDMSIIVNNNGKKDLLKREKSREEKGNWGNKWEFLFSGLSYAVGLGNVWRLVCRKRGLKFQCDLFKFKEEKFELIFYFSPSIGFPILYTEMAAVSVHFSLFALDASLVAALVTALNAAI